MMHGGWPQGAGALLVGAALWFAPPALVERLRGAVLDGLRPGLLLVQNLRSHAQTTWQHVQTRDMQHLQAELQTARDEHEQAALRLRRLAAHWATQAQQELTTHELPRGADTGTPTLFLPALVEARVLGVTLGADWRSGRILAEGAAHGVREESLVLHSRRPLIDLGDPDQLSSQDPLLMGSTVVGKIDVVGRWTSTFLPVTDPDFRAAVQILRPTEAAPVWGPTGILRGNGGECLVEGIPADASVRVGDTVYSSDRDELFEAPLFYGEVIAAELGLEDRTWTVTVRPASTATSRSAVRVLRAALNPRRLWTSLGP